MTKKIGITGGIATGKTTLLNLIKDLGFPVISCDDIVKELYSSDKIKQLIKNEFGSQVLSPDGEVDKKTLLNLILKSEEKRKSLESLIHPLVKREIEKFLEISQQKGLPLVFVEVPLLFECGWEDMFDEVWVITCNKETQRKRILERPMGEAFLRLSLLQIPLQKKEALATRVFSSEKTIKELKDELRTILKGYLTT